MIRVAEIDTIVQELRVEPEQHAFTHKLSLVVAALGGIPDQQRDRFPAGSIARLRELAEETVQAVERRIESGGDDEKIQQQLAGTVYEIRRRMEVVEAWFKY